MHWYWFINIIIKTSIKHRFKYLYNQFSASFAWQIQAGGAAIFTNYLYCQDYWFSKLFYLDVKFRPHTVGRRDAEYMSLQVLYSVTLPSASRIAIAAVGASFANAVKTPIKRRSRIVNYSYFRTTTLLTHCSLSDLFYILKLGKRHATKRSSKQYLL